MTKASRCWLQWKCPAFTKGANETDAKDRIDWNEPADKLVETATSAEDPLRAMAEMIADKRLFSMARRRFGNRQNRAGRRLVEALADDRAETMLYGSRQSVAWRFLGSRFCTDGRKKPDYSGPFYDIYEIISQVSSRSDAPVRRKLFYFDSNTQLLVKAAYSILRSGQRVSVETLYSNWTKVNGQAVAGGIARLENGKTIFSISFFSSHLSAAADDGTFSAAGKDSTSR